MRLYRLIPDGINYQLARPGFGLEAWMAIGRNALDFAPIGERWQPGLFQWANVRKRRSTFFSIGGDPTLLGVTYEARRSRLLWKTMERCGEFLPIEIESYGEALAYRIVRSVQAVDVAKSDSMMLKNGNRVILKPVFKLSAFNDDGFFRSIEEPLTPLCVEGVETSDILREYVRCNMTGLKFECLCGDD